LAAAIATIGELRRRNVPTRLDQAGLRLKAGIDEAARAAEVSDIVRSVGPGCRTQLVFDPSRGSPLELKSFVQQELIKRAILWSGPHTLSAAHRDQDLDYIVSAYAEVSPLLREAVRSGTVRARLRGEPVEPVFRRTSELNFRPRPAGV